MTHEIMIAIRSRNKKNGYANFSLMPAHQVQALRGTKCTHVLRRRRKTQVRGWVVEWRGEARRMAGVLKNWMCHMGAVSSTWKWPMWQPVVAFVIVSNMNWILCQKFVNSFRVDMLDICLYMATIIGPTFYGICCCHTFCISSCIRWNARFIGIVCQFWLEQFRQKLSLF